jgi:4-aminobutyrate aminotransferase-like enzyme
MRGDLEAIVGQIPGPRTLGLQPELQAHESRNVTYIAADFPVFWESASGATVTDVDGNRYIDLTAAFGVANAGHCNPRVVSAIAQQAQRLMHGMGDVHPTAVRAQLLERLARILPAGLSKSFLATTGSEAIEAALKTAILATGKSRFASYRGAYHGLSFGALSVGGLDRFRVPFAASLGAQAVSLDFPRASSGVSALDAAAQARDVLAEHRDLAALLIEPVQGRAGCILPPPGYLAAMRNVCDQLNLVMIVDEIFTGFGRTGAWFAVDRESVVPDIICIGKAMGSGFPISAAAARAPIMDAWPISSGEALHTSTYLGNPMGCAAALATIDEFERERLPQRAGRLGARAEVRLNALRSLSAVVDVRGCGLLWGVELRKPAAAAAVVKHALARGAIALQSGVEGATISITPPLVITEEQLDRGIDILESAIAAVG